ncbi:hypothetical protein SDC9_119402 [bioreactor metagenome]|uniref:Uncharacterized protein n=1 Tax=bioreactor metagenome TaxID=1076179 RepID=A0A645C3N9_9ZZZZ
MPERKIALPCRQALVPRSRRIPACHPAQIAVHRLARRIEITLFPGSAVHFRRAHRRETVGKDIVGRDNRITRAVQREIVGAVGTASVSVEKFEPLRSDVEKALLLVFRRVEFAEHVDDAPLHPHVFGGVVNRAVAVEAGEIAAELPVDRMFFPERDHIFDQLFFVPRLNCLEHGPPASGFLL